MGNILISLFFVYSVAAQTPSSMRDSTKEAEIVKAKAIVEEINLLSLLKTQYDLTPYYTDVYSDKQGKVRKVIMYGGYPEAHFLTIEYFDEEGNLCYLIFGNGDAEERGHYCPENTYMYHNSGNAYFSSGEVIAVESKYWCGEDMVLIPRNDLMFGEGDMHSGYDKNTQELEERIVKMKNDTSWLPEIKKSTKLFSFSKNNIKINDDVVINTNDVIIREGPTLKSGKKEQFDSGMIVKIIEVGYPETIGKFGTHKWYKIEHWVASGWVFGAFIEPVYFEFE